MKNETSQQKVLDKIKEAIVAEELAIPLYSSHIKQAFFWSSISKDKQNKIIKGLKTLEKDSNGHVKLLNKIKKIYLDDLKKS